jgi:hypothetical protein
VYDADYEAAVMLMRSNEHFHNLLDRGWDWERVNWPILEGRET